MIKVYGYLVGAGDLTDFFDGPDDPSITLQQPVCPTHFLEVSVTGECEGCL